MIALLSQGAGRKIKSQQRVTKETTLFGMLFTQQHGIFRYEVQIGINYQNINMDIVLCQLQNLTTKPSCWKCHLLEELS